MNSIRKDAYVSVLIPTSKLFILDLSIFNVNIGSLSLLYFLKS